MAKTKELSILVEPVFSLKTLGLDRCTKEVILLQEKIDATLALYSDIFKAAWVTLAPIPGDVGKISGHRSETFEDFTLRILGAGRIPVHTPYLLGVLRDYEEFLFPRMSDVLRIETFFLPNIFAFQNHIGREVQLCITKLHGRLMLDISVYVDRVRVNNTEAINPGLVRGLFASGIYGSGDGEDEL